MPERLTDALEVGAQAMRYVSEVSLDGPWSFDRRAGEWRAPLTVRLTRSSEHVPLESRWYVLVQATYPLGSIKFAPAKADGVTATFQHQEYNGDTNDSLPFRSGWPCLTFPGAALGKLKREHEPQGAYERLTWHAERLAAWLYAAVDGHLSVAGEAFELPALPPLGRGTVFGYNEAPHSVGAWRGAPQHGLATFTWLNTDQLLVRRFRGVDGFEKVVSWGEAVTRFADNVQGVWLRLAAPPVLEPWQHPRTWCELNEVCSLQRVNLIEIIMRYARQLRSGANVPAIIGYPIPERIGEEPTQMHWQALVLPQLSLPKKVKGWRTDEVSLAERDRRVVFLSNKVVDWCESENLSDNEVGSRGHLPASFRHLKVVLLGAGALGSGLAEALVRAGLEHLVILDPDMLRVKNVVRHRLTARGVGFNKAVTLAGELNQVYIHAKVEGYPCAFPPRDVTWHEKVAGADVLIDCTADDSVLTLMEQFPWAGEKTFVVLSLGWRARTLHCYTRKSSVFLADAYFKELVPVIVEEQRLQRESGDEAPREGVGCWHPVFPARYEDVSLFASVALKHLEEVCLTHSAPSLSVYSQTVVEGRFTGVTRKDRA